MKFVPLYDATPSALNFAVIWVGVADQLVVSRELFIEIVEVLADA
jgi:hypothetical protein